MLSRTVTSKRTSGRKIIPPGYLQKCGRIQSPYRMDKPAYEGRPMAHRSPHFSRYKWSDSKWLGQSKSSRRQNQSLPRRFSQDQKSPPEDKFIVKQVLANNCLTVPCIK